MPENAAGVAVTRSPDRSRYEITVDGEQGGFTAYVDRGQQRIFYHTEISEAFSGRGLGSSLVGAALADVRVAGLRAVPVCPFVKKYVDNHPDAEDLVDPVTPDALAAVPARGE